MVCHIKIADERVVLTLGAGISLVCLFAVFFIYFGLKVPHIKRHSTTLILRRCAFEIIFVSQYIWIAFVPHSFFWTEYSTVDDDSFDCETNPRIWPLAWLTQFSLLGAELWFAALAVDIQVSLTNPFSSHKEYDMLYRIFVYTFSGLMATILVSVSPIQYGVSTDPMIWVKDQYGRVNWMKIGMFYMFIPFIYCYGAVVLVWARWQIHRGLEETLKMRKYSVSKLTRYVIGYFCFYAVLYTFQFVTYLKEDFAASGVDDTTETGFRTLCAFLLASRGVWSLGIFVISNWHELSSYFFALHSDPAGARSPPKEEEELVHLNVALQKEIVRFTASGIRQALRAMQSTDSLQRSSSGRTSVSGPFLLFPSKIRGDVNSFMVDDFDIAASHDEEAAVAENPIHDLPLRASFRRSSLRNSLLPETSHSPSVDQISYDMSPRPAPAPAHHKPATSTSSNTLSGRILESVRRLMAPRSSFQFTDFSPKCFANLRLLAGITADQYRQSFASTTMPDFSGGRSGAFVYFSHDYKYIVKTCTLAELGALLRLLPDYERYLTSERKKRRVSLLARYLGAHRIVMYDIPIYFLVMQNVCPGSLDEKYDLKGSWIARHGSKKKKDPAMSRPKKKEAQGSAPLFLDNDLQNCFLLQPEDSRRVAAQLDRDTAFLQRFNLMDYSLLVGVQKRVFTLGVGQRGPDGALSPAGRESEAELYGQVLAAAAVEGPGTFYIGLIDLLQEWTWMKWIEYRVKVWLLRMDGQGVSAVEPAYYRQRFMQRAVVDVFDGVDRVPAPGEEDADEASVGHLSVSSSLSSVTDSRRSRASLQIFSKDGEDPTVDS